MPTRILARLTLVAALGSACTDAPRFTEPHHAPTFAALSPLPCTIRWKKASSDAWENPSAWDRGSVPTRSDVVCIDRQGTYTVTVARGVAGTVHVGSGATGVFFRVQGARPSGAPSLDADKIVVHTGARLRTQSSSLLDAAVLENLGVLDLSGGTVRATRVLSASGSFINVLQPTTVTGVRTAQLGASIDLFDSLFYEMSNGSRLDVDSGAIVQGFGGFVVRSASAAQADVFLNGGMLEPSVVTRAPLLMVLGADVHLTDAWTGALGVDVAGDSIEVSGTLPSHGTLAIQKDSASPQAVVHLPNLRNDGIVTIGSSSGDAIRMTGSLVNNEEVRFGTGAVRLELDSLHNAGLVVVTDSVRLARGTWRNDGRVQIKAPSSALVVAGAGRFLADWSGSVEGTLFIEAGGTLGGGGSVGRVVSSGGTVWPGDSTEIDVLDVDTLILDPASLTVVNIGDHGPHSYGEVQVTGHLLLGGQLMARPIPPFYGDGSCGQLIRPITSSALATQAGTFQNTSTPSLAPDRAWRVNVVSRSVELIGYDPLQPVSFSSGSPNVVEAGRSDSAAVCLGDSAPTSDVLVSLASDLGRLAMSPNPLPFTTMDWMHPRWVGITAIDDSLASPSPQSDSISVTLTSGDPRYDGAAPARLEVTVADDDPGGDLTGAHVGGLTAVSVNQQFEALLEITNNGPGPSSGATLDIHLIGVTYVSNGSGAVCGVLFPDRVTCTVGPIAPGASVRFAMLLRATTVGVNTNTVFFKPNERDPVLPNVFQWTVTVN